MSCRSHPSIRAASSSVSGISDRGGGSGISLLPQFNLPSGVHDFSIEHRPPQLPARNSSVRLLGIFVVGVLCLAGLCTISTAIMEPLRDKGGTFRSGVTDMVSNAITGVNAAAERQAQEHYAARAAYLQKRGLRRLNDVAPSLPRQRPVPVPGDDLHRDDVPLDAPWDAPLDAPAALLTRMAALRDLDDGAVEQHFPRWLSKDARIADTSGSALRWNEDVVVRDLVRAVSQLAHRASIDSPERTLK
tara:strand:- start:358 stop:1095 length:738 start_codon:yes stop_codon:yes gene_type:complete